MCNISVYSKYSVRHRSSCGKLFAKQLKPYADLNRLFLFTDIKKHDSWCINFPYHHICVFVSFELRFPSQDSIIKILRRRYGNCLAKKVQKCKKFDFKYRKTLLIMEFLQSCKKEQLILKSLQFKRANNWLGSSEAYLFVKGVYWTMKHLLNVKLFGHLMIK